MAETAITAIIPVFNDRPSLEIALETSVDTLSAITPDFEILVAEDGSTDGSTEYVREFEKRDPRVRLLHSDERQGRGRALNRAIREARGSIVCYYDVDLATDMKHLPALISAVRDGSDISTGSRLLPDSDIVRSGDREIASRGYNLLVRLILRSSIYDHQCGFKAFNRDRILPVLPAIRSNHWFWDTEILVRSQRKGYRISELPVRWRAGKGTTVRFRDVFEMGTAILRLWWQIHVSEN
ncbi:MULTISPECIES: dolichyl-phosphate beta-glucosyltransferase [unclassified Methanoregula]|uniref:dolichyl-phosphate beta-glucosyltransferase n=1 Tax=unclassified Methanoregula TaxID=2649730 RepID=UPI0009D12B59|nr:MULTISPECIES: dolichyl-phosphate beta-glucosyltransferase [unclassified Methanoregula]OPX61988.1 MAG: Glycosyltransferase AglD [Methanoregula sp. PtaB.Bin085]OPY34337.1 MAG: Glycosyltransferase AglD [Methanoregula sp. PtaU1.Bin006]